MKIISSKLIVSFLSYKVLLWHSDAPLHCCISSSVMLFVYKNCNTWFHVALEKKNIEGEDLSAIFCLWGCVLKFEILVLRMMGIYIFVLYLKTHIRLWTVILLFWKLEIQSCHFACVGRTQRGWRFTVCPLGPLCRVHSCIPLHVFHSSITVSPLCTSCASHPPNEPVITVKAPQFVFTRHPHSIHFNLRLCLFPWCSPVIDDAGNLQ